MNIILSTPVYTLGFFAGHELKLFVAESYTDLHVWFVYGNEPLQLPKGQRGRLEYETIDTLDLKLPKTYCNFDNLSIPMLEALDQYCSKTHKSIKNIGEDLYLMSKWGDKRDLAPDPILDNSADYGALVEHLAMLKNLLVE